MQLLLASSSPYRRQQLAQLGLPFDWASPDIDETPYPDESVDACVQRLSEQKARALAAQYPQHWIIGSDQACSLNGEVVSKPGNHEQARQQLLASSGQRICFSTGVALWHAGEITSAVEHVEVQFRPLSAEEIEDYLMLEQPYDCAGSFKVESLGIHLFDALHGRDINSLIGLPLIRLCDLMRAAGLNPLGLAAHYRKTTRLA
ncbi:MULTISPECIES: nucleoside triphosphate pyrophosphatase [unclassified Oceanobacter]|uniref:Maf family protein n=2 Tax=Gammaproteobacteria TaxID=1236 RepID=UPI0027363B55|nr:MULTISPECIES: Maf family protein [unclassified Oceanobacter]MDP2608244.1 Maf family protein [Oceanobacter sp. 1_MG-2023]MDP2612129.1 Maf family protein [Oceanobacter sp. 2_MG-2023]